MRSAGPLPRYKVSPWWGSESFGGVPRGRSVKTNPKGKRPVSARYAMHLVMRSEQAVGRMSMRHQKNFALVESALRRTAARYKVKLHKTANVGNHLHVLLSVRTREDFLCFTRRLAASVACGVLGGRRGQPKTKFWNGRPFSRIVTGGAAAFWRVESYIILNELEAVGILPPRALARLGPAGFGKRMRLLSLARRIADGQGT